MRVTEELDRLGLLRSPEAIDDFISRLINRSEENDDPIYFSDLLADHKRSIPLQHALFEDEQPKYHLECIVDEWGNVPNPGEFIERKIEKPLVRNRKPIPGHQLSTWKRQGVYDQRMMKIKKWEVDEKGCIVVNAKDALYFLSVYGVHGDTGAPISYHQATSVEPVKVKGMPHALHVHFHRFREVEKADWKTMPKREMRKGPRRETSEYYEAHKTKK